MNRNSNVNPEEMQFESNVEPPEMHWESNVSPQEMYLETKCASKLHAWTNTWKAKGNALEIDVNHKDMVWKSNGHPKTKHWISNVNPTAIAVRIQRKSIVNSM